MVKGDDQIATWDCRRMEGYSRPVPVQCSEDSKYEERDTTIMHAP